MECGHSRQTQKNSALAGWAKYGYCASHSRYFWGLRLHLIATPAGLPIAFALAGATADEREVCLMMCEHDRLARPGQIIFSDSSYRSTEFEQHLNSVGMKQIRPAVKNEKPRPGKQFLRPFRQLIEAIIGTPKPNSTWKTTTPTPTQVSSHESHNAYSPTQQHSGTTKPTTHQDPHAHSQPTTTTKHPLEQPI